MKTAIAILCLLALPALAQDPYPSKTAQKVPFQVGMKIVPDTNTKIVAKTCLLDVVYLSNTTAAPVTVTITDGTTNCNSAACQIVPVISIPANTVQLVVFQGLEAKGGVYWVASANNAIHGWLKGSQ